MSSSRFWPNNFTDYEGQDYLSQSHNNLLREDICQSIENSVKGLFQLWEDNLNQFDPNDISVYTGITGAALLYLKIHDSQIYPNSSVYLEKCYNIIEQALKKCQRIRTYTFICGEIGLLTVAALVNHRLGRDSRNYLESIASVGNTVSDLNSGIADETLYGRAGYLFSLLLLRQRIENSAHVITDELIRSVIKTIFSSGIYTARLNPNYGSPLVYFWYEEAYVGAAHGYGGILCILLEAGRYLTEQEKADYVKPTIDFLCTLQFPSTANFPACIGERRDQLVSWCHGSPGIIHLLAMGYKEFSDSKYLEIATIAAEDIWQRGLLKKGIDNSLAAWGK